MGDRKDIRHVAYTFLQQHSHGALASSDTNGRLHVTSVYCVADTDFQIYFTTETNGAKYDNIVNHPDVAMSFADEASLCSLQLRGVASRVVNHAVEQRVFAALWRLRFESGIWPIPPIRLFEQKLVKELRIICIQPTEMTYACFSPEEGGKFTKVYQKVL